MNFLLRQGLVIFLETQGLWALYRPLPTLKSTCGEEQNTATLSTGIWGGGGKIPSITCREGTTRGIQVLLYSFMNTGTVLLFHEPGR